MQNKRISRLSYSIFVGCVTFELNAFDVAIKPIGHSLTENSSVGGTGLG